MGLVLVLDYCLPFYFTIIVLFVGFLLVFNFLYIMHGKK